MSQVTNSLSRWTASALGNVLLTTTAAAVSVAGLGVGALYMADYIEETPAMIKVRCLFDATYAKCPERDELLDNLQAELDAVAIERDRMLAERDALEKQLAGLRAIEAAVDEITTFKTHYDPHSDLSVTVGTVYREFVKAEPEPARYFCYINLQYADTGVNRNFYIRNIDGLVKVTGDTLDTLGISQKTWNFGLSVCKPETIGS